MLLLVGLGNPGTGYAQHRHNVGFMAVDAICAAHGFGPFRQRFQGQLAEGRVGSKRALALKPSTFMNESGRAVAQAARFHKLEPGQVFVFYDELDLPPGKVRVKQGGGHGGHNGVRSIEAHIGKEFWRVRIGIGHPGDKARVQGYVLHDFAKADRTWRDPLLEAIAAEAGLLADGAVDKFMTRLALLAQPT